MSSLCANALAGQLLIATPAMQDPNFAKSVILICEHNADGALGLMINRQLPLRLGEVLGKLNLPAPPATFTSTALFSGGPVQSERGFVLHDSPDLNHESLALGNSLAVSASEALLTAIAEGSGPRRFMLLLGYAGWGGGQLEHEFAENAWLAVPASPELIFDIAVEQRWQQAAARIGLDPARFSIQTGHA